MYNKLIIAVILSCISVVVATQIFTKEKPPVINAVTDLIAVSCSTSANDLMQYVKVDDGINIFLENNNWQDIVEKRKVTYVAIDDKNQVSKISIAIKPDQDLLDYKIVPLQDTVIEQNNDFKVSDYFALQNTCGWTIETLLSIENVNVKDLGEHEIIVRANNDKIEPLETILTVKEFQTPIIKLKIDSIKIEVDDEFEPEDYLESIIDNIDDLSFDDVIITSNVDVKNPGNYIVNYSVVDSDGNVGKAQLKVEVKKAILQTTATPKPSQDSAVNNTPTPRPEYTPNPDPEQTPDPTPEVTPDPTDKPTQTPNPSPDPEPEVTPDPSPDPEPEVTPDPEPEVTPDPPQETTEPGNEE